MTRDLILAIDGGQTSTKSVLARRDGTVVAIGSGPPCDHIYGPGGREANRRAIHGAAHDALANANRPTGDIIAVGMGLTSAAREYRATPVFESIVRDLCDPDAIWVDTDYVSNLYGASAGQPGVVVIAGTGSIGYGIDEYGNEGLAAGLGYMLGDDGSAWYIGLQAIIAATRASDGRGPDTALLPFVREHYGLDSVREIVRVIYADGFTRDQVANITPGVVRLAATDAVASDIVTGAGEKLGEIVLAATRQVHQPGDPVDVFPTGGVFTAGAPVLVPFRARILTEWPQARIHPPRFAPVYGALLMAIRTLGDELTPETIARIESSSSEAQRRADKPTPA